MTAEQNEIINKCLILAYSPDGTPEMGELAAQAHGLQLEYERIVRGIKLDCFKIMAAVSDSGYFDNKTNAYNFFNIKIGENKGSIYDALIGLIIPYGVRAFLKNEPLELYFLPHEPVRHCVKRSPADCSAMQLKIANNIKKELCGRFGEKKGLYTISLKINHASGETTINKSIRPR
jgi:hypothetical protein